MSRRSPSGIQAISIAVVVAIVLFGIYSYNDLHGRLRRSEEKGERLKQQQDSVSAQLQVVYEHKSRLEKSLQQEKDDRTKMKQEMLEDRRQAEKKLAAEKDSRITALTAENKRLQGLYDDIQTDLTRIHDKQLEDNEEKAKVLEQNKLEYMQLKQERENDQAQLKDKIANLERRNANLEKQRDELNAQPAAAQQDDDKAAEVVHVKQRSGDVRRDDAAGHVRQQADHFNRIAESVVDHIRERKANLVKPIIPADDTLMQIGKPDDENQKGYFVPKVVKSIDKNLKVFPVHHDEDAEKEQLGGGQGPLHGQEVLQVAPPKVDEHLKESNNIPVPKNLLNSDDANAPAGLGGPANGNIFDRRGDGGQNQLAPAQNLGAAAFNQGAGAADLGLGAQGLHQGVLGPNQPAAGGNGRGFDDRVENQIQKDIFPRGNARIDRRQKPEQIAIPRIHNRDEAGEVDAENRNHGEEEDQRDLKEYEDEKVEAAVHPQRNRADVRGPNVGPVEDNL